MATSSQVNLVTILVTDMDISNVTAFPIRVKKAEDFDTYRLIKFYLLGFIIPIGMLFNLFSCAVFLRSRMQKSSTVFYFFALACADNCVLLGEFLLWLNSSTSKEYITGLNFMETIDGVCKFVHFLRYFGRLFSSWLVVAICIERFITVAYPLKSTWSSTPAKAKLVIAGLAVICFILSCPAFFAVGTRLYRQVPRCLIMKDFLQAYKHWQVSVMTAGELVIPSILVIIFTALIMRKLVHAHVRRVSTREGQGRNQKQLKDKQPTIALLAVSIAFITLRTVYVIVYPLYRSKNILFPNLTHNQIVQFYGVYTISFVLAVTNYAINFLLYIVTGKRFRDEYVRFLLCKKSQLRPTLSRSSRSHSITSQTTSLSLRRFSNTETLRIRNQAQEDSNDLRNYQNTTAAKYMPVRQNSQL